MLNLSRNRDRGFESRKDRRYSDTKFSDNDDVKYRYIIEFSLQVYGFLYKIDFNLRYRLKRSHILRF